MSPLNQLQEKIIKVIPEIIVNKNAQIIHQDHSVEYFEQKRPITLEDVLIAIKDTYKNSDYIYLDYIQTTMIGWQLGKPLHLQSEAVVNYLNSIL